MAAPLSLQLYTLGDQVQGDRLVRHGYVGGRALKLCLSDRKGSSFGQQVSDHTTPALHMETSDGASD